MAYFTGALCHVCWPFLNKSFLHLLVPTYQTSKTNPNCMRPHFVQDVTILFPFRPLGAIRAHTHARARTHTHTHSLSQSSSLPGEHTALTKLLYPGQSWASYRSSSQFFPASSPGTQRTAFAHVPKWSPCQCCIWMAVLFHAKYLAKPFPAPLLHLFDDVVAVCLLPDFSVGDSLLPPNA